ncbi:hypothetical protein E2C01_033787 [Portunus trituberculatus]|uniref:Uncharacterized protein n=1 Tax=Portunus trituberculatus TaxID=210409 RepID=A0A5B7EZR6_PORTR|nr:hypothetical protein [Portunus trituberculatus]
MPPQHFEANRKAAIRSPWQDKGNTASEDEDDPPVSVDKDDQNLGTSDRPGCSSSGTTRRVSTGAALEDHLESAEKIYGALMNPVYKIVLKRRVDVTPTFTARKLKEEIPQILDNVAVRSVCCTAFAPRIQESGSSS